MHPPIDPEILSLWSELRRLVDLANKATKTQSRLPATLMSEIMTTLAAPLLKHNPVDIVSHSELLRLSMLALLKNIILPFPGYGQMLAYMLERLKLNLLALQKEVATRSPELRALLVWSAMMAASVIYEEGVQRAWLRDLLVDAAKGLEAGSWEAFKGQLVRFVWIDALLDQEAVKVYMMWLA